METLASKMQARIDLGYLVVESKTAALSLDLPSQIFITPSEEDDVDRIKTELTAWKLNPGSSTLPWITCDRRLDLILHFRFEDDIDAATQESLMESLSIRLQNAEVLMRVRVGRYHVC